MKEMKSHRLHGFEFQVSPFCFIQQNGKMIGFEILYGELTNAVAVSKGFSKIHKIKFVAHGVKKPANFGGVSHKVRFSQSAWAL